MGKSRPNTKQPKYPELHSNKLLFFFVPLHLAMHTCRLQHTANMIIVVAVAVAIILMEREHEV